MEKEDHINWQEASVHTSSKSEIYQLLSVRGGYYLSTMEQANRDYIRYNDRQKEGTISFSIMTIKRF